MKTNEKEIRHLLALFLDGETSLAEERELYLYFRRRRLPADLERYREMMAFYADGLTERQKPKILSGLLGTRWGWLQYSAVAAAVALVVTIGVGVAGTGSSELSREEYLTYAGSYIIRDGQKITDLEEIMPDLRRAEETVERQNRVADEAIDQFELDAVEQSISEVVDINDPDIRAALESALSD